MDDPQHPKHIQLELKHINARQLVLLGKYAETMNNMGILMYHCISLNNEKTRFEICPGQIYLLEALLEDMKDIVIEIRKLPGFPAPEVPKIKGITS